MRSVHLLTCTCLGLQTDLLHTHEKKGVGGWGGGVRRKRGERQGKGRGSVAHCSALSTRRSYSLVMPAAASAATVQPDVGNH